MPVVAALTPQQADNVAALGQVWGLLKYFHPAVAAGQHDWDAEFLGQLPAMLACRATAERSRMLSAWVSSLGPVPVCPACAAPPPVPVGLAPDLRWSQDHHRFSAALRQQLAFIVANRYQGTPYYVSAAEAGNPVFAHEEAYAAPACPPPGLRLLAICRYWNMVHYFYPYRIGIAPAWASTLPQLLPRFAAAATPLAYRHAVLALCTRLQDGHATLRDPLLEAEDGDYYLAAALQFLDDQAVVIRVRRDGLTPAPPLEPGDVLTHIDGTSVAELVRQRLPETPGSNRAAQLRTIAQNLFYGHTSQVSVQVERAGKSLRLDCPRFKLGTVPPVRPPAADSMYRFLTPQVGYVDLARVQKAKLPRIVQAFAQTKGIVIDLRGYPGEFVTRQLPGYFLQQPTLFATYTQFDPQYPGRFLATPADTLLPQAGTPYGGRLVVLVNEGSLSQAEYTAMALRATPHCLLLGSPTAGADGKVSRISLPGGLATGFSGLGVYYPDGRATERVGLRPDIRVRPTSAGLRAGHDELRDRAVELITQALPVAK
ncbi:S41 family peptidase [Hymenobacter sp. BT559]|uniref:S41 family peptidase n=1 Tax=Hymenobacter sp. BT559 TaxID=2795729 RepID=UPI0018EBCEF2|nr:S41 family peptidase [Hymenobacter sp. BT559]MBJ6146176.1 hypothetical protein [Hymenobacter sp. BT559]